MEKVIYFLFEYYREILFGLGVLIELIFSLILIIKKVKKVLPLDQSILMIIPSFIREAEKKFGQGFGHDKLCYVVGKIKSYFEHETGYQLKSDSYLLDYYVEYVENILSTPEKKGDK